MRKKKSSTVFCIKIIISILIASLPLGATMEDTQSSEWPEKTSLFDDSNEDSNDDTANAIMDFLEDQVDVLPFAKYKEIVFVVGAEHTNKTTLILLLTDADLMAVEAGAGTGKFIYIDRDGPYNEYSSNIDSSIIPSLIPNKDSGIEYYILPQVNDMNDVKRDITGTHLKQRLFKFAKSVKFLCTLSHYTVQNGFNGPYIERAEIRELAINAAQLIVDLNKYKNSIAVVVTNVKTQLDIDDSDVVENASQAIRAAIEDIKYTIDKGESTDEEVKLYRKSIEFLEILRIQENETGEYSRISVFRLANSPGMVSEMEWIQEEKFEIRNMVRENLIFVPKLFSDFHYNIGQDSMSQLHKTVAVTVERMLDDISDINSDLINIHVKFEEDNWDLTLLQEQMNKSFQVISEIEATDPKLFVQQILVAGETLGIDLSTDNINTMLKHIEFLDFTRELGGVSPIDTFQVENGVEESEVYLYESKDWYSFLLNLHDILSAYQVQKHVTDFYENVTRVIELSNIERNEYKNVTDIGLKDLLMRVGMILPPSIEKLTVSFNKLQKLVAVLQRTMIEEAIKFCSPGKITVKGYNIKLSSYTAMNCSGDVKFIEIFVSNNLFIDDDINESGKEAHLFFIAPTWEVIGKRRFILNGIEGEPPTLEDADDGNKTHVNGETGIAGNPGISAGCFLAIGNKFINDENLEIQLNGGRGGNAQHGGKGMCYGF